MSKPKTILPTVALADFDATRGSFLDGYAAMMGIPRLDATSASALAATSSYGFDMRPLLSGMAMKPPSVAHMVHIDLSTPEERAASELDRRFPIKKPLTFEEASEFVSLIKIGPFPFAEQEYQVRLDGSGGVRRSLLVQRLDAKLPDRNDPSKQISLTFTSQDSCHEEVRSRGYIQDTVRRFIDNVARHEVAEWLLIDGVRVFDPHAGGSQSI